MDWNFGFRLREPAVERNLSLRAFVLYWQPLLAFTRDPDLENISISFSTVIGERLHSMVVP
jgi:hypothetical protein